MKKENKRLQFAQKIGMTILLLLLIRFMSHIPVPGVKHSMFKLAVAGKGNGYFQLYDRLTGGSFSNMTIFGAGITPYITASIVVQLLGYTSKRLNQMYHEGEYGRRHMQKMTLLISCITSVIISFTASYTLYAQGYLNGKIYILFAGLTLMIGTLILIGIGKWIELRYFKNGISLVLFINIIASMPNDVLTIISLKKWETAILIAVILITLFVLLIMELIRKEIIVRESARVDQNEEVIKHFFIPVRLNMLNVMPIIFMSTILQLVQMLSLVGIKTQIFNTSKWFVSTKPIYIIGIIVYCAGIFLLGVMYSDIAFNPFTIAIDLKKKASYIPGVRLGNDTSKFLHSAKTGMMLLDSILLMLISIVPIAITSILGLSSLTMFGTSLVIVIGVLVETAYQIKAEVYGVRQEEKQWI